MGRMESSSGLVFPLAVIVPLLACIAACGGDAIVSSDADAPDGGGSQDAGSDRSAPAEASVDSRAPDASGDCGQPVGPMYACPKGPEDGGTCGPYGAPPDAPTNATYPVGCVVTLPECNGFFPGPQTCNCEDFPPKDEPGWICPM
jgi:hypothetical protein